MISEPSRALPPPWAPVALTSSTRPSRCTIAESLAPWQPSAAPAFRLHRGSRREIRTRHPESRSQCQCQCQVAEPHAAKQYFQSLDPLASNALPARTSSPPFTTRGSAFLSSGHGIAHTGIRGHTNHTRIASRCGRRLSYGDAKARVRPLSLSAVNCHGRAAGRGR